MWITSTLPCTSVGTKWLTDKITRRNTSGCLGASSLWYHHGMAHIPYKEEPNYLVSSGQIWTTPSIRKVVLCYWSHQQFSSSKWEKNYNHCFLRKEEWSTYNLACFLTLTGSTSTLKSLNLDTTSTGSASRHASLTSTSRHDYDRLSLCLLVIDNSWNFEPF